MDPAKICVVGAGAIGGVVAARLAQAGGTVSVLARGPHLARIVADGLTLIEGDQRSALRVAAADDAGALGRQDIVIVALKAPGLITAAPSLAPLVGPDTVVVPMMNGVPWWFFSSFGGSLAGTTLQAADPGGVIARVLPPAQVVGAVVHLSSTVAAPGVIRRGRGNLLLVGEPSGAETPRLQRIVGLLSGAGFEVQPTSGIQREVWLKLWGNMNMNPISALTGSTADLIMDDPLTADLVRRMMEEAAVVGQALGIAMTMTIDQRFAVTRELGAFKTSMLQDLEAGRGLEIDAILAAPIEIGDRLGIAMPYSKAVLGLVRQRARNAGLYAYDIAGL
ncbi:ketopantoate reductase family protein [Reyranella sp. CPCC 100927]|uniref:ketopantoate reductase family protein n=1 Tax=Reyranella sp. CPCC 100927 TaxID=2599616 RepID=UPI0011B83569|nr:2-dehydropantoate 2-reductase [Reyranella sp. CPCC 100927]TWT08869.1 2-dehydropantoate 2-reductase [Reyranella sp. CPCC 100927]